MSDAINPDHYKRLPAEAIEIIESAIDKAPSNQDAYLQGQVLKYILRCWNKNGIEDLKKAKWYLDRLVNSLDEYEQQKAADLQSLKDHPFGKLKQPAWTPKVGDWVRIKKPADTQASASSWWPSMDKYDGQIIQVKQIEEDGVVLEEWGFMFDWLEPAEQPKATLNSDKIPEGYRKLGDSSEEPRQLGDLRWSVAKKRYIQISRNEIRYANRDNWAACRKVESDSVVKENLITDEKHPQPPDGWRWIKVGEKLFLGDTTVENGKPYLPSAIDSVYIQKTECNMSRTFIRRNKFEVGEKVVHGFGDRQSISVVENILGDGWVDLGRDGVSTAYHVKDLAPYIEVTREVTGEVTGEVKPPDGWRFLELGEVIRKGDQGFENGLFHAIDSLIGMELQAHWRPTIRRNRFEVGEKVVRVLNGAVYKVIAKRPDETYELKTRKGLLNCLFAIDLAPYIEETK